MNFSWLKRFAPYLHLGDRRKKPADRQAMLEEVLAEFNKARQGSEGSDRKLYLVRLSGEAMEHIDIFFKRELEEIKYKKFIKSIPAVPYQPS